MMSAIGIGFSPAGNPKVIDPAERPTMNEQQYAEEKALAEEALCSADLLVELPFWILIPESELESHTALLLP